MALSELDINIVVFGLELFVVLNRMCNQVNKL